MERGKGKKRDGARKKIGERLEKRDRAISFLVVFFSLIAFFLLIYSSGIFNKNENNNPPDDWEKKVYCTSAQRGNGACIQIFQPVCGWFDDSVQCVKYPCAETYSNSCFACMDEKVEYYTKGECPTG